MKQLISLLLVFFCINAGAEKISIVLPVANGVAEVEVPEIIIRDVEAGIKINLQGDTDTSGIQSDYLIRQDNEWWVKIQINGKQRLFPIRKKSIILEDITLSSNTEIEIKGGDLNWSGTRNPVPLWMSVLPPLIAILMALIFREVISSLLMGIFIGTGAMGFYAYGISGFFTGFFRIIDTFIIQGLNDSGHLSVIVFSMLIGGVVAVISKNGGMMGVVNRISKWAKTPKSGQTVTYFLGIGIFFDDYANTLVVGNTMRPVTDRLKISREKLAYLVDSTAAPVAAMAFVTTWIGAELGYISSGLEKINAEGTVIDQSIYGIFINSIQYSFYPIFTLVFMWFLIRQNRDFGPMYKAESRARITGKLTDSRLDHDEDENEITDELEELNPVKNAIPKAFNAIIPVATIILGTIIGLLITGGENTAVEDLGKGFWLDLSNQIGNADSYKALLWASLSGLFISVVLTVGQRIMSLQKTIETAITGFKTMLPAILILVLAWALASVTDHMHTAEYLTGLLGSDFSPWLIPGITFLLAAVVAFSTGTSWGTMAILYPLMLPASWAVCQSAGYSIDDCMNILYNTVSCVLAGAVLGDHCSPISDTTILSSLASSCNHLDHVKTQMPYALTVGGVSLLIGTVPAAMGIPSLVLIPLGIILLYLVVRFFGKIVPVSGQQ